MSRPLHIAIAGPLATADVEALLAGRGPWPVGRSDLSLAALVDALLRRGHRVSAVTLTPELPLRRVKHAGSRVTAMGSGFSLTWCPMRAHAWAINSSGGLRVLPGRAIDGCRYERRQLRAALMALQPDLVHAWGADEYAAAALATRLPALVSCLDIPQACADDTASCPERAYRWLHGRMAKWVLRRAGAVTASSPWLAELLAKPAAVPVDVVACPLPDRLCDEKALLVRGRAPAERRRVLLVARGFGPRANVKIALLAFARFSATTPAAELVLVGDEMGADQAAERWWREQRLGGRVHFAGSVSTKLLHHWMLQSDVLLHPTLCDPSGATLMCAMALGLPVIGAEASGAVRWIVGDGVRLVDPAGSEVAWAVALAAAFADRGAGAAQASRERDPACRRFAAGTIAASYEALYRRVLERALRPPAGRRGRR